MKIDKSSETWRNIETLCRAEVLRTRNILEEENLSQERRHTIIGRNQFARVMLEQAGVKYESVTE